MSSGGASTPTYYSVLGLDQHSHPTGEDIRDAYKKLVLRWHPDRTSEASASDMFRKITEAYETLSDPVKRASYDTQLGVGLGTGTGSGLGLGPRPGCGAKIYRFTGTGDSANQIFETIFGKNGVEELLQAVQQPKAATKVPVTLKTKPTATPTAAPTATSTQLSCTLEDLYCGKKKLVKLDNNPKMTVVEIPPGCPDGHQITVRNPETNQNHYFTVQCQVHSTYRRTGDNLHLDYTMDLADYINGFTIVVTLLNGKKKKISHGYGGKIVGPDLVMKVAGIGMPKLGSQSTGDLYIHFKLQLPKHFSSACS